jgi:hypothetical protein
MTYRATSPGQQSATSASIDDHRYDAESLEEYYGVDPTCIGFVTKLRRLTAGLMRSMHAHDYPKA